MPAGPTAGPAAGPSPARGSPAMREVEPKDQPLTVSIPHLVFPGCHLLTILVPCWHRSVCKTVGPLYSPVSASPPTPRQPCDSPNKLQALRGASA